MKLWITGENGMLGSQFKRLLANKRIPFVATNRSAVDISQMDQILTYVTKENPSHIINCAAYTNVDKAENQVGLASESNTIAPGNLGVISNLYNIKVIHFSTDYVFDGMSKSPYHEDSHTNPLGFYGQSKLMGENQLLEENPKSLVIRTSWLFGFPGKNFVETILRLLQENEVLNVVMDQIGRPTHCQDLAEATLSLLDHQGIFHFANSGETTWHAFAKEIQQQALNRGFPIKTKYIHPISTQEYPTPTKRPQYSALNTEKFEKTTNSIPRHWKEALNDYFDQRKI